MGLIYDLNTVKTHQGLRNFSIEMRELRTLQRLGLFIRHWKDRSEPFYLALFEQTKDSRGRILVEMDIAGRGYNPVEHSYDSNSTND